MPETLAVKTGRTPGSAAAGRLRSAGRVPGVIYGHGMEPVAVDIDGRDLRHALSGPAGVNAVLSIDLGGSTQLAMTKELQRHPVRNTVTHVDFIVVRMDEVVSADVPLVLVGTAEAVEAEGGAVDQVLYHLTIQALPGSIPNEIEVDITSLAPGHAIHVSDVNLPSGATTELDPETVLVAASAAAAVEEEPAEGEGAEGEGGEGAAGEGEAAAESSDASDSGE